MPTDPRSERPVYVDTLVSPKEKVYFAVCVLVSIALYLLLAMIIVSGSPVAGVILFYAILFVVGYFMLHGIMIGRIRGNGVRVSERQFPELMAMAKQHSRRLDMEVPDVFVLQSGGILNAFATRFLGRNFVVLYSDVLALATQKGEKAVSFVLGHELGHVKRHHMTRRSLLYPAMMFPFLGSAYSRACEYTCDKIGNALEPAGSVDGLLVLAAGRDLYNQVDAEVYAEQRQTERGFFVRFAEVLATHPNLTKRVAVLGGSRPRQVLDPQPETAAGGL
ncbi:MAG: M48 family metallopeptidase [Gemmatimonadaceae bacterium]